MTARALSLAPAARLIPLLSRRLFTAELVGQLGLRSCGDIGEDEWTGLLLVAFIPCVSGASDVAALDLGRRRSRAEVLAAQSCAVQHHLARAAIEQLGYAT
ncbi:hypothetical protein [Sphingomonas faeni]|uniref:hypothetical protein n=1 Tax=Sphingomonas faeni TaxID=185950 RepID=UPI00334A2DB1